MARTLKRRYIAESVPALGGHYVHWRVWDRLTREPATQAWPDKRRIGAIVRDMNARWQREQDETAARARCMEAVAREQVKADVWQAAHLLPSPDADITRWLFQPEVAP
jgi:hypothetical protein